MRGFLLGLLCALWAVAAQAAPVAAAQAAPVRVAVFDLELYDTSLEGELRGRDPAETARLTEMTALLRAAVAAHDGFAAVDVEELPTLADSLGGGIGLDNRLTFAMCRDLLDEVVLLDEDEIAAGIRHAYSEEREILEGGGAVGIAALLAGKVSPGGPVVTVLSGRNIDMTRHWRIIVADGPAPKHPEETTNP
jgi:threonine dehydratase